MLQKTKERYLDKIKEDGEYEIGIHPLQILIDLDDKNYEQMDVADEIGKSQPAISQVINRKSRSLTIAKQISDILIQPFVAVWGMTEEEYVSKKRT